MGPLQRRIRAVQASRAAASVAPAEHVVVHETTARAVTRQPAPMPVWRERSLAEAARAGRSPFSATHEVAGDRL